MVILYNAYNIKSVVVWPDKTRSRKNLYKSSAYKSGWIVKPYKQRGGKYEADDKPKNLKRWYKEKWVDIGNKAYPMYRPTKNIS